MQLRYVNNEEEILLQGLDNLENSTAQKIILEEILVPTQKLEDEKKEKINKRKKRKNKIKNDYKIYNPELLEVLLYENEYQESPANIANEELNVKLWNIKKSDITPKPSKKYSKAA